MFGQDLYKFIQDTGINHGIIIHYCEKQKTFQFDVPS